MKIGYKRVSTFDQNEARQLADLELEKIFVDKASGATKDRPALLELQDYARQGDHIFVHSLDRFGRNLDDLKKTIDFFIKKDVEITFVKEGLHFDQVKNPISNLMVNVMGAFAEFERSLIRERQREGIELAKKKNKYKGRKPKLDAETIKNIQWLLECGGRKNEIAAKYGISRQTLYTLIRRLKSAKTINL